MRYELTIPQINATLKGKTLKVRRKYSDGREKEFKYEVEKVILEKESWGDETPVVVGADGEKYYPTLENLINIIAYEGHYTDYGYGLPCNFGITEYIVEGWL